MKNKGDAEYYYGLGYFDTNQDKRVGVFNFIVPENKTNYTKSNFINLKIIEDQLKQFSISLEFFDLSSENLTSYSLPVPSKNKIFIKLLKEFSFNVKNNGGVYLLNMSDPSALYRFIINAHTSEIITKEKKLKPKKKK